MTALCRPRPAQIWGWSMRIQDSEKHLHQTWLGRFGLAGGTQTLRLRCHGVDNSCMRLHNIQTYLA
eukprot:11869271-Karenia_brevis.AAC.1